MHPARGPPSNIPFNRQTQPYHRPQLPPLRLLHSGPVPPNYNPPPCCSFDSRQAVSYTSNLQLNSPPTPTMQRNFTSPQQMIPINRGVSLRSNATDNTGSNEVSVLLEDMQWSMSSTYEIIRNKYITCEKELQELRKIREDLSAINANMKREITTLKRERSLTSKQVEKLKKDYEAEVEKVAQQQTTVAEIREELRESKVQTKSQAEKIASLEEKCRSLEESRMKYNELLSSNFDKKLEHFQTQSDLKYLTAQTAGLNQTVESQKMKIASLSAHRGNLLRENEKLRNQLKVKELELKAEKLLKEQILKEEMDVLTKPTFLNKMLRQKCEQDQLFNLANIKRDVDEDIPEQGQMPFVGERMSVPVKRRYDRLIAEAERLKEKLSRDDPLPGTSQAYDSSMKKTRMPLNSIVTSSMVFSDEMSELECESINGTTDSYDSDLLVEMGEDPEDTQSENGESTPADDDD